jgi:hypothetical protein
MTEGRFAVPAFQPRRLAAHHMKEDAMHIPPAVAAGVELLFDPLLQRVLLQ